MKQSAAPFDPAGQAAREDEQPSPSAGWQHALRDAFRTPRDLIAFLQLDPGSVSALDGATDFSMLVPRSFVARMRKGDPHDPLLRQVLPDSSERETVPGFDRDPLAEMRFASDGVIRKYSGRALLIATGACPVHCRYCFRRHFPYAEQLASRQRWSRAIATLRDEPELTEVILSGGDPLTLTDDAIMELVRAVEEMENVHTLRLHSRFPIMIPERVDRQLLKVLTGTRLRIVMVVHCNHPNEIDGAVQSALLELKAATAQLLNQSVLLHRVNDNEEDLAQLSEKLFDAGVLPYYLHLLDPVAGTAHFDVTEARAKALIASLRRRLPGYLVPRLVREVPGEPSKTVIL
ncbi:MAG: EF-P beta-lysylation protein EpmB [Pseudomonadales bacterium]|nr:EF-P beta-lysylation protein EpmB [Pseudomonadales bacterium]NIX06737.1 EF-P beta-lysylation protein EpmB [Pseudomonadales bacterium]